MNTIRICASTFAEYHIKSLEQWSIQDPTTLAKLIRFLQLRCRLSESNRSKNGFPDLHRICHLEQHNFYVKYINMMCCCFKRRFPGRLHVLQSYKDGHWCLFLKHLQQLLNLCAVCLFWMEDHNVPIYYVDDIEDDEYDRSSVYSSTSAFTEHSMSTLTSSEVSGTIRLFHRMTNLEFNLTCPPKYRVFSRDPRSYVSPRPKCSSSLPHGPAWS